MNYLPLIQSEDFLLKRGNKLLAQATSWSLETAGVYYVTGPLASGKTTLLETIVGILPVLGGTLTFPLLESLKIKGQYISDLIAYVPQRASLPAGYVPDMYYQRRYNAAEQDDIPLVFDILNRVSNDKEIIHSVLELMHLEEMAFQPFIQLSNGQTRRLLIAIGLLKKPAMLVLDNPFIGLDVEARAELSITFQSIASSGISIIISGDKYHLPVVTKAVIYLDGAGGLTVFDPVEFANRKQINPSSDFIDSTLKLEEPTEQNDNFFCQLKKVSVQYGNKKVLNQLDFEVRIGEHWLIQGPNGSGKSTLLGLLYGDHPQAYANEIYLFGQRRGKGESIWDIKKRIGFFSPELLRYYDQNITCLQAIGSGLNDFIGLVKPLTVDELQLVIQLMKELQIEYLAERSFLKISDGEQRLVLLARSLIKNPPILILDEPLQGLDEQWLEFLKQWLEIFSKEKTLLLVSHESREIPNCIEKFLKLG